MKIIIEATEKEIAALVVALQERPESKELLLTVDGVNCHSGNQAASPIPKLSSGKIIEGIKDGLESAVMFHPHATNDDTDVKKNS